MLQQENFLEAVACGDREFTIHCRPAGDPPGQIIGRDYKGRRVLFDKLPAPAQKAFLRNAGKEDADQLLWPCRAIVVECGDMEFHFTSREAKVEIEFRPLGTSDPLLSVEVKDLPPVLEDVRKWIKAGKSLKEITDRTILKVISK